MKKILLTQGQIAFVDDADFEWLSRHKWYAKKNRADGDYYAARSSWQNGKVITIYMHREIMDCPDGMQVDHENHNTLDCRRQNLEVKTQQKNLRNRRGYKSY